MIRYTTKSNLKTPTIEIEQKVVYLLSDYMSVSVSTEKWMLSGFRNF